MKIANSIYTIKVYGQIKVQIKCRRYTIYIKVTYIC